MIKSRRTLQEYRTTLSPAEVLTAAKRFFMQQLNIYSAYIDKEGPNYCTFRGQGTEEIVIAATEKDGATLVSGSTYLYDMQVARFFTTLPAAEPATVSTVTGGEA